MKQSNLYPHVLSIFLAIGAVPFLSSCDETPNSEKAGSEKVETEKESKEAKELEETAEEAEGAEAAKEAIKKKEEEEEKESEARKERQGEKNSGAESLAKASPGMKRR